MIIESYSTPIEVLDNCVKHLKNFELTNPLEYQNLIINKGNVYCKNAVSQIFSVYLDDDYNAGFKLRYNDNGKSVFLLLHIQSPGKRILMHPHQEYIWCFRRNEFIRSNDASISVMVEYDDIIKKVLGLTHDLEKDSFYWEKQ